MLVLSIYTFLFIDSNKFYLYNSRANFFSEISEELYNALKEKTWDRLPKDVIDELRTKEILLSEGSEYDYYYSELLRFHANNNNRSLLSLTIAPTTKCNFDCPYCFEPKLSPKTINTDIINKIVEFVKSHKEAKSLDLSWYGGEPLLAFHMIKLIYKALNQKGMPKIRYHSIITNGYCFNYEIIDFFKQNRLNRIQITFDGIKERHDKTRCIKGNKKPTFDIILANIDKLVTDLNNTIIDIRVNINKSNYMDFIEIYNLIHNRYGNNKQLNVYPGIIREETEDKTCLCSKSYKPSELLELYKKFKEAGINSPIFPKRKIKGCMMHALNAYIIGPEGEIYKCWNDVTDSEKVVGNITSNELSGSARFLKYSTQAIPFCDECKKCFVFPLCEGGCSYHRYRNMFEGCNYELCSPYKDPLKLKEALLTGEIIKDN